jgi:squalene-hopene/tetraprenyl-beta-curcumene cyclase
VLGLEAAGLGELPATKRGVRWLLERQKPNGRWDEDLATGTGFPNVFYLAYHLYRDYFPLLALATLYPKAARAEL